MKIAAIHYHFDRGGVTQVVLNHLAGLAQANRGEIDEVFLVYGGRDGGMPEAFPTDDQFPCQRLVVDGLEYDPSPKGASSDLANSIATGITQAGGSVETTILHIHNHSLGKNASMCGAVAELAKNGWSIVLQIHDFAEDYRPRNYSLLIDALKPSSIEQLEIALYPQASNIHYATLTQRDHKLLDSIGVSESVSHVFANSVVDAPGDDVNKADARQKLGRAMHIVDCDQLGIYPVRGIRRKNVGEMLLWAAVCPGLSMGITLPPTTPAELASYDRWKEVAGELNIPVLFDIGTIESMSFAEVLASSDFIFTSSVAEGFGMVFLEAWLAKRPLFGRDLPGVTADFREAGIQYPNLQSAIRLPQGSVSDSEMEARAKAYHDAWASLPPTFAKALSTGDADSIGGSSVDFAHLTPQGQVEVLRRVARDEGLAREIREMNPAMLAIEKIGDPATVEQIDSNRRCVQTKFSPVDLGNKMLGVYGRLLKFQASTSKHTKELASPPHNVSGPANPGRLLAQLASFETFTPCRTDERA